MPGKYNLYVIRKTRSGIFLIRENVTLNEIKKFLEKYGRDKLAEYFAINVNTPSDIHLFQVKSKTVFYVEEIK